MHRANLRLGLSFFAILRGITSSLGFGAWRIGSWKTPFFCILCFAVITVEAAHGHSNSTHTRRSEPTLPHFACRNELPQDGANDSPVNRARSSPVHVRGKGSIDSPQNTLRLMRNWR